MQRRINVGGENSRVNIKWPEAIYNNSADFDMNADLYNNYFVSGAIIGRQK